MFFLLKLNIFPGDTHIGYFVMLKSQQYKYCRHLINTGLKQYSEIIHHQLNLSYKNVKHKKSYVQFRKYSLQVCIYPLLFPCEVFKVPPTHTLAWSLMKLKCQVRVALYHVLSIKVSEALCICC